MLQASILLFGVSLGIAEPAKALLKIHAEVPDRAGPVPVRAIIETPSGIVPGEWGSASWPEVEIRGKAVTPESLIEVPAGPVTITVGKGPDYLPQTITTNLAGSNLVRVIRVRLEPVLGLYGKGWRAGDAHIHYFHGDGQISRSPEEVYGICTAAGLDFASLADEHYGAPTLTKDESLRVWKAYQNSDCPIWLGAETPKNAWGHHAAILYDPWSIPSALPYEWGLQAIHAQGGVVYPVHPERSFPGRSFAGESALFPLNNYYKYYPVAALAGHLLDGWSGISDEAHGPLKLSAYDRLLKLGYRIPLLADSDFCMDRVNNGPKGLGFWMNYFHLDGEPVTRAAVATAIRKGRVMTTSGPLVLFTIDGGKPGDILPADGRERIVRIEAAYEFNPWTLSRSNFAGTEPCHLVQIELIRNGEVIKRWTPGTGRAVVEERIQESSSAYYMVRVLGNEGVWMAGYASPIYFESEARPSRPPAFKAIVNGRVYDARSGMPIEASISCVRYGKTEWTIQTDARGLFRARVPIDAELVARDAAGRELSRNLLNYEPAYAFCHNLPENFIDKALAIDEFAALIGEMEWEFPIGWQDTASYVLKTVPGEIAFSEPRVISAPPPIEGKNHAEIAMVLLDKTSVQPGDTVNYAVLLGYGPQPPPREQLVVECHGWEPRQPRMYTRYGTVIHEASPKVPFIDAGSGFYMFSSSFDVPEWAANVNSRAGALRFSARIQQNQVLEEVNLTLPVGKTRRELLVSSTWDGLAASWGDSGAGPCWFAREGGMDVRYPDYRSLVWTVKLNGVPQAIMPKVQTRRAADADDALFTDRFYYDGQCEPEFRNIAYRDPIRAQPPPVDFSGLQIHDPGDVTPPVSVAMEPMEGERVTSPVRFYYHIDDAGLSGADSVSVFVDGRMVGTGALIENPVVMELPPGEHRWQVEGRDRAGNSSRSETKKFFVVGPAAPAAPLLVPIAQGGSSFGFMFSAEPGRNYLIEEAHSLEGWRAVLRTNVFTENVSILTPNMPTRAAAYRVRVEE